MCGGQGVQCVADRVCNVWGTGCTMCGGQGVQCVGDRVYTVWGQVFAAVKLNASSGILERKAFQSNNRICLYTGQGGFGAQAVH